MIKESKDKKIYAVVKGGNLNVRREPTISSEIMEVLKEGQRIQIKEAGEVWHKVAKGYVMAQYVQMAE